MNHTLVFVPTYNEKENAQKLYAELRALDLDIDILFMDDNSPDGTGQVLDQLASQDPHLKVLHRKGKLGVGSAHLDGIQWAYKQGYQTLVTMDCDFTHPPKKVEEVLKFKQENDNYDIIVASRFIQKNSLKGWNLLRKSLTHLGHLVTRTLLRMPYDATGGFRCYRLDRIPSYAFSAVTSKGYSFFFESLYILNVNQIHIGQIPINLPPRTYGHSKMNFREVRRSVSFLFNIFFTTLLNSERYRLIAPLTSDEINRNISPEHQDDQGWDDYWEQQKGTGGLLYDTIAAFYRKFIIKPTLNYFIKKYFSANSQILHAGCGGGQVDTDISQYISITGLDISIKALNFYKKTHQGRCSVLHGSIFEIPLKDQSVDGIYNLGVMEHFTEEDIHKILREFYRVLKPKGRMVIFWPPEFGLSVVFLKGVKFFLENVMGKKNVKIHPDEITRVQSQKHVENLFKANGFSILRYYFGMKDFFTYSVIVVEARPEFAQTSPSKHSNQSPEGSPADKTDQGEMTHNNMSTKQKPGETSGSEGPFSRAP